MKTSRIPPFVVRRGTDMLFKPKRLEILVKLDSVGIDQVFQVDIEICLIRPPSLTALLFGPAIQFLHNLFYVSN